MYFNLLNVSKFYSQPYSQTNILANEVTVKIYIYSSILFFHFYFKTCLFFIHFLCLCLTPSHHYDAAFPPNLHGDGLLFDPSVPIATLPSLYLGNVLFLRGVARITFVIVQMGESVIIYSVLY